MGIVKDILFPKQVKPDNSILIEQQKRADAAQQQLKDEQAKIRRLGQTGRSSLIMTGGQGVEEEATIMKRTLGGYI